MFGVNLQIFLGCIISCFCRINYDEYLSLFHLIFPFTLYPILIPEKSWILSIWGIYSMISGCLISFIINSWLLTFKKVFRLLTLLSYIIHRICSFIFPLCNSVFVFFLILGIFLSGSLSGNYQVSDFAIY